MLYEVITGRLCGADFDQRDQVRRVQEVGVDEARRLRDAGGEGIGEHRRRGRRDDRLCRQMRAGAREGVALGIERFRITSYNVCYTKLLRVVEQSAGKVVLPLGPTG